jgi:hypothetical protein
VKWRDEKSGIVDCFCGAFFDVRCLSVEEISETMKEHTTSAGPDHVWHEPERGKFVGEQWGFFVDEHGELWRRNVMGWEFVGTPGKP